jgi:hypothetical protein
MQALNLLRRKKPADAIAALEPARKYELGFAHGNATYVAMYVRGFVPCRV